MEKRTEGTVISIKTQWWLKINTKSLRKGTFDGATFPHVIKIKYIVDGKEIVKRKWLGAHVKIPELRQKITVFYKEDNPKKIRLDI